MRFRHRFEVTSQRRVVLYLKPPTVLDDVLDVLRYLNGYLTHIFAGNNQASIYAVNDYRVDMMDGMLTEQDLTQGSTYLAEVFDALNELILGRPLGNNRLMHGHYCAKWLGQKGKEFIVGIEPVPERHGLKLSLIEEVGINTYSELVLPPFNMVLKSNLTDFQKVEMRKQLEQVFLHQLNAMALHPLNAYMQTLTSPLTRQVIQSGLSYYVEHEGRSLTDVVHEAIVNLYSILWQTLEGCRLTAMNANNEKITDYVPTDFDSITGQIVLVYLPT